VAVSAECLPARRAAPLPRSRMPRAIPAAEASPAMGRRGFFGHLARGAAMTANAASAAGAPHPPPLRRRALATPERERRLELLGLIAARAGVPLPASLFPALAADGACCNHNVCAAMCPTRALHAYRDADHAGLAFDAAACIACGACVAGCPEKALTLDLRGAPAAAGDMRLTRHRVHECADCGAPAREAGGPCDACRTASALARDAFSSIFQGVPQGGARTP
jgi:formate hydrogenlyase subunit 6/NADH:ubiquinone oxidoreductase subunit I